MAAPTLTERGGREPVCPVVAAVTGSIGDCVSFIASLPNLTIPSAIVLGLSIVLMLVSAQVAQRFSRARRSGGHLAQSAVVPMPNPRFKSPNPVRRLLALITSGAIGIILGALIAILLAYSAAFAVIRLTDMLGR